MGRSRIPETKVVVASLAVFIALVMGGTALWRSLPHDVNDPLAYVRETAADGQRIYRQFPVARVLEDRDRIRQIVEMAPRSKEAEPVDVPINGLFDLFADFTYYRLGQPSAQVYRNWREDQGYQWRSIEDMMTVQLIQDDFAYIFPDEKFPADPKVESLFDKFWMIDRTYHPDANQIVAICTDKAGLVYSTSIATPGNPTNAPILGIDNDHMIWHGASANGGCCWYKPPRSRQEIMNQYGRVIVGQVAAVIEFEGGSRCPLAVSAIWDPQSKQWMMENIIMYNRPEVQGAYALEY